MALDWPTIIPAGLSGGGLTWLLNFLNERSKNRAYTMGAVDKAVDQAMKAQSTVIERLEEEVLRLNLRVIKAENAHEECQRQIAELMQGPVAVYHLGESHVKSGD